MTWLNGLNPLLSFQLPCLHPNLPFFECPHRLLFLKALDNLTCWIQSQRWVIFLFIISNFFSCFQDSALIATFIAMVLNFLFSHPLQKPLQKLLVPNIELLGCLDTNNVQSTLLPSDLPAALDYPGSLIPPIESLPNFLNSAPPKVSKTYSSKMKQSQTAPMLLGHWHVNCHMLLQLLPPQLCENCYAALVFNLLEPKLELLVNSGIQGSHFLATFFVYFCHFGRKMM